MWEVIKSVYPTAAKAKGGQDPALAGTVKRGIGNGVAKSTGETFKQILQNTRVSSKNGPIIDQTGKDTRMGQLEPNATLESQYDYTKKTIPSAGRPELWRFKPGVDLQNLKIVSEPKTMQNIPDLKPNQCITGTGINIDIAGQTVGPVFLTSEPIFVFGVKLPIQYITPATMMITQLQLRSECRGC